MQFLWNASLCTAKLLCRVKTEIWKHTCRSTWKVLFAAHLYIEEVTISFVEGSRRRRRWVTTSTTLSWRCGNLFTSITWCIKKEIPLTSALRPFWGQKGGLLMWHLGNRKHFQCFYRSKRTKNAVGTRADKRVFPELVRVRPSFHTGFILAIRLWASDFYRMIHNKGESTTTR